MSRKDRKQKIKDLLTLEKVEGPVISLYLPLHPREDSPEQDTVTLNSLIDQAKTTIELEYSNKLWNAYEFQLNKLFANGLPTSETLSQGLLVYVTTDSIEQIDLNFAITAGLYINPQPLLWPILINNRPQSDFDLLLLQKHQARLVRVTYANQVTFDTILTIAASAAEKADSTTFFTSVDEQILTQATNQDQLPLILVANEQDQGAFRKVSKNRALSASITQTIDPNLQADRKQLAQLAHQVADKLTTAGIAALQTEITNAQGAKKFIQTPTEIVDQIKVNDVATLVLTLDTLTVFGDASTVNDLLKQAVAGDTEIFIFTDQVTTPAAPLAILRHAI